MLKSNKLGLKIGAKMGQIFKWDIVEIKAILIFNCYIGFAPKNYNQFQQKHAC